MSYPKMQKWLIFELKSSSIVNFLNEIAERRCDALLKIVTNIHNGRSPRKQAPILLLRKLKSLLIHGRFYPLPNTVLTKLPYTLHTFVYSAVQSPTRSDRVKPPFSGSRSDHKHSTQYAGRKRSTSSFRIWETSSLAANLAHRVLAGWSIWHRHHRRAVGRLAVRYVIPTTNPHQPE